MLTIALSVLAGGAVYCVALHALRRARQYVPPGKPRDALDQALRVMGGGGPGTPE